MFLPLEQAEELLEAVQDATAKPDRQKRFFRPHPAPIICKIHCTKGCYICWCAASDGIAQGGGGVYLASGGLAARTRITASMLSSNHAEVGGGLYNGAADTVISAETRVESSRVTPWSSISLA